VAWRNAESEKGKKKKRKKKEGEMNQRTNYRHSITGKEM